MRRAQPFARVAAKEALLAAACGAVARQVPDAALELQLLAAAHRQTARRLAAGAPRRWLTLQTTIQASLAAALGSELGALSWLRRQEQLLIAGYVDLEAQLLLDEAARHLLRRELVPEAFARFARVDQLIMPREEQGAYA